MDSNADDFFDLKWDAFWGEMDRRRVDLDVVLLLDVMPLLVWVPLDGSARIPNFGK